MNQPKMTRVLVEKERNKSKIWIPTGFAEVGNVLAIHTRFGWVGQWNVLEILEGPSEDVNEGPTVYSTVMLDTGVDLNDLA